MCQQLTNGEVCKACGRRYYKGEGRRLSLSDDQIRAVLENYLNPVSGQTRKQFCSDTGISQKTCCSIVYGHLKNVKDRARIDKIAEVLGQRITWDDL